MSMSITSITSFGFLLFVLIGVVVYYLIPRSWQWVELLILSVLFYCMMVKPYTIVFLAAAALMAYLATNCKKTGKGLTVFTIISVLAVVGMWFVVNGTGLWKYVCYKAGSYVPLLEKLTFFPVISVLGMGYYTLQIVGYILDCYLGNIQPQKNPLKLFLFTCFFPQLTTGPISRYQDLSTLFEKHPFSYQNITFGAQRILWGFCKKLVLAERAAVVVNGIWNDYSSYTGFYRWIALLLFPVQLYADFSGCMDVVIGTAELFGIKLAENFRNPFFSRTNQEFWQRWHITLGSWAKDYVLYPVLKSSPMVKFSKFSRKHFGKKAGKFLATALGMLCLWMIMGIWHGAPKYIVGVSLWYWLLLMLGELFAPLLQKIVVKLSIRTESFSWHLFQSVRTYLIYAVGVAFFRAPGIKDAVKFLLGLADVFSKEKWNPWVLFDGSVLDFGITHTDINIMILVVVLLIIVGILREKYTYARNWIAEQILPFRWLIWCVLFIVVLIYGKYGPGYNAAEFIYQGF